MAETPSNQNAKSESMEPHRERSTGAALTTNQGLRITHTDDSLKAGERGPTLMEDFHLREKMMHFDHERIPERVVHARGSAAHGVFRVYGDLSHLTKAGFLRDTARETPVFVRFSTVVGFRGSADTVRDVRGFATKFYTDEGVYDLVGNNMPVFFIQDGIKFPDLVHAIKPEPHNEMPQASAAHDTFWDFISLMPESIHMIMWVLSDRGIPRSYAMMEGFGVHTFRFINEAGESHFVKLHWKPLKPMASLVWDEAQKIAGKDPDFNRRDLWEAIERGDYPEFELGIQTVPEADEHAFDFDLLDPTKLIPEELVPVQRIGRMTLNRNPDNFFAETEQVAFHPGHVVPGIDFTNDPLLQARLFSYLDTQLTRLGGPNFAELPINRPTCPVHNNQRDGFMRQTVNVGRTAYSPNSLGRGCPMLTPESAGGYAHYMERVEGHKVRTRSESFKDHFSQAALFYRSQSPAEQRHLIDAACFELGKVDNQEVRARVIDLLARVDQEMANTVAARLGMAAPKSYPAPTGGGERRGSAGASIQHAPTLSMENPDNTARATAKGRMIAVLLDEGFDAGDLAALRKAADDQGAVVMAISRRAGQCSSASGADEIVDKTFLTASSVMFDAVFIPGGEKAAAALGTQGDAVHFINEAFRHGKPIGAAGAAVQLLERAAFPGVTYPRSGVADEKGVVSMRQGPPADLAAAFLRAVANHRSWERETDGVPA